MLGINAQIPHICVNTGDRLHEVTAVPFFVFAGGNYENKRGRII